MAKKKTEMQSDEDAKQKKEEIAKLNKLQKEYEEFNPNNTTDYIRIIRQLISPSVEPFLEEIEEKEIQNMNLEKSKCHYIDIGEGLRYYLLKFSKESSVSEKRAANDALKIYGYMRLVESRIKKDPAPDTRSIDAIFDYALKIGVWIERIGIRPLEPLIDSRLRSDAGLAKRNSNRRSTEELKLEAQNAIKATKKKYRNRASDIDFIKEKAAESLGIKKNALNKRLNK